MGNSASGGRSAVSGRGSGARRPDRLVQAAAALQRGLNRRGLKVQNIRQRLNNGGIPNR
jgi:hypothetical protein